MIKRILSLLLCMMMLGSTCVGVFAADEVAYTTESIRVFNPGADITVNLTGTAGEHASVIVFQPGASLPDMTTDYNSFDAGIRHVDSVTLDDEGKYSFKYYADEAGVYTVYVSGAEIDYSATDNDAPSTNPDRIYVESWTQGLSYSHPDLNYMIVLSKAQLDTYGAKAVAKNIWNQLESQPEGRRTLFIKRDLSPYYATPEGNGSKLWWDEGVEIISNQLDEFFKEFKAIENATVDFLYADMEHTYSMYAITPLSSADRYKAIEKIYTHERWPEFKAELEARGYDSSEDGDTPLKSVWNYYSPAKNYLKFNAVCAQMANDYFTQAIYEPAKKHFAKIRYAEYASSDRKAWLGAHEMGHSNYIGGNIQVAGTHSAVPLYSKRTWNYTYFLPLSEVGAKDKKAEFYSGAGKDFTELQGTIEMLRTSANATKENTITPWIATQPVGKESYSDERYRNEMFMHIALHNPDRLLHYNSSNYVKEEGDDENIEVVITREEQTELLMNVIDEVNGLIAFEDRRSLNVDHADYNVPFAISGIYADGKNIFRITPDTAIVSPEAFLTSADGEAPVFAAGGTTVTFPQGSIIAVGDTTSDIGYWVETPIGVMPKIAYAAALKTEAEAAVINFYDVDYGKKVDPATVETVDAVALFKGYYDSNLTFIAAKYDENGMLIDIESKECGIFNPNGVVSFNEISKDLDTADLKFFLWEDGTIRPLADEAL